MRIIAGKYRGRNLKSPPSLDVRPTSDRLRETLFNVIAPNLSDSRFLDLCAGSGAVGIEALSRGVAHVTFVDRSRRMCALIKSNLELVKAPESEFVLVQAEATDFLRRAIGRVTEAWDIIFFDPPYQSDYLLPLSLLGKPPATLLAADGTLICEHHHKNRLPEAAGQLRRFRVLKQGDSALSFYRLGEAD